MHKSVREFVVYWDHIAWYFINTQWHNQVFDAIMPFLRNQWFWAPLYFFLLLFMPSKFGRKGLVWCAFFLISFALSDQISAHLLKTIFHRVRPCNNPYLAGLIHVIVPCGGGYSFPSSHAANHFSMGIFSAVSLHQYARWVLPVALIWAASIAYAQVYVGVHFPVDVTCGALIGIATGWLCGWFFNRYLGLRPSNEGGRMAMID